MTSSEPLPTEHSPLLSKYGQSPRSLPGSSQETNVGHPEVRPSGQDDCISRQRAAAITSALGLLVFLQATNMSILTTTQSKVAEDLDTYEGVSWFTTAYLVFVSSFAPLMGRLSSIFTPRVCIASSGVIFAIGSVLTSLAKGFSSFLLGRVVGGIGGAGVYSISVILVVQHSSYKHRGVLISLLNTSITFGVSLGAVIAGALLGTVGWRALFFAQAPLSILASGVLLLAIPTPVQNDIARHRSASHTQQKLASLDYVGAATLTTSIVLLLISLSADTFLVVPLIASVILISTFLANELYLAKDPLIPIVVLKSRGVLLSCLSTVGFMMCRWAVLFFSPVFAIAILGWSPAAAGGILIPTNAGFAVGGLVVGLTHIRRDGSFFVPTLVTYIIFPFTIGLLALTVGRDIHPGFYLGTLFCNGFCVGAALNYALAHVLHLTLPETHFVVTSLLATFRGFAGSFGSAIGGGVFSRALRTELISLFHKGDMQLKASLLRQLMGAPVTVQRLTGLQKVVAIEAYSRALRSLFWAAVGLAVLSIFAQAGVGWKSPQEETAKQDGSAVLITTGSIDSVDGSRTTDHLNR